MKIRAPHLTVFCNRGGAIAFLVRQDTGYDEDALTEDALDELTLNVDSVPFGTVVQSI